MRTSLYLIGLAAASIVGAGAVGFGCSSSSSPPPAADSGTTEASVEDSSGGEGGGEDAPMEAAPTCTPVGVNVETFDSGSSSWACFQAQCMPSLTMCAADCTCDNAILGALLCVADGGAGATTACFGTAFGALSSNTAGMAAEMCIVAMNSGACSGTPAGDGGTEGGDAAPVVDSGSAMDAADGGG